MVLALIPVENGTWKLPCLSCGRMLDYETMDDEVVCECGIKYAKEMLSYFREPGQWRHWMANFSCACVDKETKQYKVKITGENVEIQEHRCFTGQVTQGRIPSGQVN